MRELRIWSLLGVLLVVSHLAGAQSKAWVSSWAASPEAAQPDPDEPLLRLQDQTVRERVRVSIGGDRLCLRLSNEYGRLPLVVGSITVASPQGPRSVRPESMQTVTFGGRKSVTIPAGAPMLSDPVELAVSDGGEISISLYFPGRVTSPSVHSLALKSAVVSPHGDHTRDEKLEGASSESSVLISAIYVSARPGQRLVVAFGDSLTDGDMSTVDADRNWPSALIRRLGATPEGSSVAVVNAGIAGNRLLSDGFGVSALARFDRDVLAQPGVTHIVLLEGINDIAFPGAKLNGRYLAGPGDRRSAEDLIDAYRQLIVRAHARGIKLIGATMPPFEGARLPGYYSAPKDAVRQSVNRWIRTGGAFDAVIDFDAVLRDPAHPGKLLPRLASEDHLHPNDSGYQVMADAIDLTLFQ